MLWVPLSIIAKRWGDVSEVSFLSITVRGRGQVFFLVLLLTYTVYETLGS